MRIFRPLRHPAVALVWGSQVLSAVGDEMNRLAAVWIGSGLWGARAGHLLALHAACAFLASAFGGRLADRLDPKRTLIIADVVRCVAVVAVPVVAVLGGPLEWVLPLALAVCGVAIAVFEPALRSSLQALAPDPALLTATNALVESTARFARVVGPSIIAFAGALIPTVHLFTIDAVILAISAAALALIPRKSFASGPLGRQCRDNPLLASMRSSSNTRPLATPSQVVESSALPG